MVSKQELENKFENENMRGFESKKIRRKESSLDESKQSMTKEVYLVRMLAVMDGPKIQAADHPVYKKDRETKP